MKPALYLIFLFLLYWSCSTENENNTSGEEITKNISEELVSNSEWLNNPDSYVISDSSLSVIVSEGTDFFNNPEDGSAVGTAPLLYRELGEDFVAYALVEPDFTSQWNAVSMMVYLDSLNWIKFAFESSDATGPSIVSVVTKGTSDDANGVVLNEIDRVWLAIIRKDNIYSMHWAINGEEYNLARLTKMPDYGPVKIGIEFQSPVGEKATHTLHYFHMEERTVENLR